MSQRLVSPMLLPVLLCLCAFLVGAFLVGGSLVGCSGAPSVTMEEKRPEESKRIYRKVEVDSPGRADNGTLVCILGDTMLRYEDEDVALTHVLDESFHEIGFFLSDGATYRLETNRAGDTEEEFLGNHTTARSIERLTGVAGPYRILRGL